jgi:hypothetical protein
VSDIGSSLARTRQYRSVTEGYADTTSRWPDDGHPWMIQHPYKFRREHKPQVWLWTHWSFRCNNEVPQSKGVRVGMTRLIDSGVVPEASRCWMIIDFTTSALRVQYRHIATFVLSCFLEERDRCPIYRGNDPVKRCAHAIAAGNFPPVGRAGWP